MISQEDIVKGIGLSEVVASSEVAAYFGTVVVDSRQVSGGDLFVALRGERDDGHNYVGDALRRGARGILAERIPGDLSGAERAMGAFFLVKDSLASLQALARYWRGKHDVRVVGITGSVGKTTTKELVAALLGSKYKVLKNEGNLNNEIGLPLTLLKLDGAHERAVLEMGMYAIGEIALLCEMAQPAMGVVTNVGYSHFGRLESLERIAQAKCELVRSLPEYGVAILNGDDARVRPFAEQTRARVVQYGLSPEYEIWADHVESAGVSGVSFILHKGKEAIPVDLPLVGKHNVHNALAAAAVAFVEGFEGEEIAASLKETGNRLRLVALPGVKETTIIDDTYNASPASMSAALELLAEVEGRKIAVLGDMFELGSYEAEGHLHVGRLAAQTVQILVAVGERGRILGKEAARKGLPRVIFANTNEEALEALLPLLHPGDCILVKGSRGMAMEQIVARLKQ
ncbi:MAG: UDP-N-acetylmuramoyl-tripeptide--D-alanyl-D-alanine ligase [Chloroflexi bacterium]|nr:UDP-N-acetylmuramoyl-tripeptide--D-alanyl-D-alanine ligase [Chloroflexota bacterium]